MSLLSSEQEILIAAPPRVCWEHFADLERYPTWEPSAREVQVLERAPDGQVTRAGFLFEKRLAIFRYRLTYSLRCQRYETKEAYWIKFDEAAGDLQAVMNVIEFRAHPEGCLMKYRGILDDPLLVRRALMAFFGPRELTRHLERFRQHVQVEAAQASVLAIP